MSKSNFLQSTYKSLDFYNDEYILIFLFNCKIFKLKIRESSSSDDDFEEKENEKNENSNANQNKENIRAVPKWKVIKSITY